MHGNRLFYLRPACWGIVRYRGTINPSTEAAAWPAPAPPPGKPGVTIHDHGQNRTHTMIMARKRRIAPVPGHDHEKRSNLATIMT
jgi:hypothetical protein